MSYFSLNQKVRLARSILSKSSPAYVQFYVTARCNLACEQCNIIYGDASADEMNIEQIKRVAENLAEIGVCIILLIGGEPFVRRDLPEIVKAFTDVGIHVRLQTNGLASRDAIEACVLNGAHDISVSLDTLRPSLQEWINGGVPGSWNRAIETIATINEVFPETATAFFGTVLMPHNVKDIPDVVDFATRIGWGVSVVPIHVTTPDSPRGFQLFDDSGTMAFDADRHNEVRNLILELKRLRNQGFTLYDSDEYLDDIYRFICNKPLRWRRRNGGVCDSPNLYFAIAPNGNLKVCCDYETTGRYPVYHSDFTRWYLDGRIHDDVYARTRRCNGCMYGSYPEITISSRFFTPLIDRFKYFNFSSPPLKKLSANELNELARQVITKI